MKQLKYFILTVLSLLLIALVLALFLPRGIEVESTVVIDRNQQQVFNFIKKIKNQRHYAVWYDIDPYVHQEFVGVDGTIGFRYKWKSDLYASGEMVITNIDEGRRLDLTAYISDYETVAYAEIITFPIDAKQTRVIWRTHSEIPYPKNLFLFGKNIQKQYDDGLVKLKEHLENLP